MQFPDNLSDVFNKNPYFGFWLSHKVFKGKTHHCFSSSYGNTLEGGLHAPSEYGQFWYRWLPKNAHYANGTELSENDVVEMRHNFYALVNRYNKPLIIKNLAIGQRLKAISRIVPNAKFIYIKRDPAFAVQSLFTARKVLGIRDDEWWGIKPRNHEKLLKLDLVERAVKQVFFIEKQIEEDRRLFPQNDFLTIQYEDLCSNCEEVLDKIYDFLGNKIQRINKFRLDAANKQILNDQDFSNIQAAVGTLNWNDHNIQS